MSTSDHTVRLGRPQESVVILFTKGKAKKRKGELNNGS